MHLTPLASARLSGLFALARQAACLGAIGLTLLVSVVPLRAEELPATPDDTPCADQTQPACATVGRLRARAQQLISSDDAATALSLVASYEALYVGDPDYDYLLGVTALSAGEYTAAVHALERAVLVQPGFAGAWLDLAIANYRLGEIDTADQLLKHVEDNFSPPPEMRRQIASVRAKFTAARLKQVARGWQSELGLFAGYSNNANYGLSVSTLQLTLDGLPATLLLDPSYQPRADSFKELRGSLARTFQLGQGERADIYGVLRQRLYTSENDLNQTEGMVSGIWRTPWAWRDKEGASRYVGATLRNLYFDGRSMTVGALTGGLRMPVGSCNGIVRADYEYRMFSGDAGLDAAIPWLGIGAECGKGAIQYGAQQRIGRDHPMSARAGGDTVRLETVAYGRWQLTPGLQIGGTLVYAHASDSDAYSPILANGARRWVQRFGQKLEAVWVPGANPRSPWAIVIEIENVRDQSNIGLSSVSVTQVGIGISYRNF